MFSTAPPALESSAPHSFWSVNQSNPVCQRRRQRQRRKALYLQVLFAAANSLTFARALWCVAAAKPI